MHILWPHVVIMLGRSSNVWRMFRRTHGFFGLTVPLSKPEPEFLKKLRQQKANPPVCFSLPSLLTIPAFVNKVQDVARQIRATVRRTGARSMEYQRCVERGELLDMERLASAIETSITLATVKHELVALKHWDPDKVRPGMVTWASARCILRPVVEAAALIPGKTTSLTERFLDEQLRWYDADAYVKTRPMLEGPDAGRIPSVCVMGHIDHGKTTFLDTLQQSAIAATEAGKITQSIRAFTLNVDQHFYPRQITFVDTPGHKIFGEMRLRGQQSTDMVLLLVALDEGVQGQTLEVVQMALQHRRPVVVALNKCDMFTDASSLAGAIAGVAKQLKSAGLLLTLVDDSFAGERLDKLDAETLTEQGFLPKADPPSSGLTAKKEDSASLSNTLVKTGTRRAFAVAISGLYGKNMPLLFKVLSKLCRVRRPRGDPIAICQAVIIESFKRRSGGGGASRWRDGDRQIGRHDGQRAEDVRAPTQCTSDDDDLETPTSAPDPGELERPVTLPNGQRVKSAMDVRDFLLGSPKAEKSSIRVSSDRVSSTIIPPSDANRRQTPRTSDGGSTAPTSRSSSGVNDEVVICCIVRSGILKPGLPFVADQGWGIVHGLEDQWGRKLTTAVPGMTANVTGLRTKGCPGAGTHIMQVDSSATAEAVSFYRRLLQRYVESNQGKHLDRLRPAGMDCRFLHVGNYGQVKEDASLEFALLHKNAQPPDHSQPDKEASWRANQLPPDQHPKTEADMETLAKQMHIVWVNLRVDTWHTARLLTRELPRLGTKGVVFQVVGVSFSAMNEADLRENPKLDLVLNFRGPKLSCSTTAFALEQRSIYYREFNVYSDVIDWVKQFALRKQKELERDRAAKGATSGSVMGLEVDGVTAKHLEILGAAGVEPVIGPARPMSKLASTPDEAAAPRREQALPKIPY